MSSAKKILFQILGRLLCVVPIQPYRVIGCPKKTAIVNEETKSNGISRVVRYLHAGEFEDFSNDIYSCNKIIAETDNVSAVEKSSL